MATAVEPIREIIGRALYHENGVRKDWNTLSARRREPWCEDGDRVLSALAQNGPYWFAEYAHDVGGVDWLAVEPDELFRDFLLHVLKTKGPKPGAWLDVPRDPKRFA